MVWGALSLQCPFHFSQAIFFIITQWHPFARQLWCIYVFFCFVLFLCLNYCLIRLRWRFRQLARHIDNKTLIYCKISTLWALSQLYVGTWVVKLHICGYKYWSSLKSFDEHFWALRIFRNEKESIMCFLYSCFLWETRIKRSKNCTRL